MKWPKLRAKLFLRQRIHHYKDATFDLWNRRKCGKSRKSD